MQPAQRNVLDGKKQFGLALDQQRFVRAAEIDWICGSPDSAPAFFESDFVLHIQLRLAQE